MFLGKHDNITDGLGHYCFVVRIETKNSRFCICSRFYIFGGFLSAAVMIIYVVDRRIFGLSCPS